YWQDFERLHGYYQSTMIEALIDVKEAKIRVLKRFIDEAKQQRASNSEDTINELKSSLTTEKKKSWTLQDVFRGARGSDTLLRRNVELRKVGVFTEKEKFLVRDSDIAES
ncbi:hypothetical protein BGX27_003736, partial [Mortierella sp. AM989]